MAVKLTDRQREIKALLDKGQTPKQIAEALGITENAIYQQRRRIKAGNAPRNRRPASRKGKGKTTQKRSRPSAETKPTAPTPVSPPARVDTPEPIGPLQAINMRKREIESHLKASGENVEMARKTFEREDAAHTKLVAKHEEELKRLRLSEQVLKGELPKTKAAKKAPPAQAPAPPEPVAENSGDASDAATPAEPTPAAPPPAEVSEGNGHVAAEDQAAEERPGVPTVPEFSQAGEGHEDAFGE